MKAITLHQPYASLIASGIKTVETRSWRPGGRLEIIIGERIAIHAGQEIADYCDPRTYFGDRWNSRCGLEAVDTARRDRGHRASQGLRSIEI